MIVQFQLFLSIRFFILTTPITILTESEAFLTIRVRQRLFSSLILNVGSLLSLSAGVAGSGVAGASLSIFTRLSKLLAGLGSFFAGEFGVNSVFSLTYVPIL